MIGLILLEKLHPYIQNKIQKMTKGNTTHILRIACLICTVLIIIDTTFSAIKYLNP